VLRNLLFKGAFWRGLNYLSVFGVTIGIARLFHAGESGVINLLINNLAILILITGFSIESATGYYSAKDEISQQALIGISLLMSIGCFVISALSVRLIPGLSDNRIWFVGPFYCAGILLMNYFTALFYSHYNYALPNVIVVVANIVLLSVMFFAPAWLKTGRGSIFINLYFMSFFAVGLVIALTYISRYGGIPQLPAVADLKKIVRYATLATIANIISFLVYRVDYWFVNRNCTDAEMGNYIQASKVGQIFLLFPAIIASVLFTRTAGDKSHNTMQDLQQLSRMLFCTYLVITLLIAATGYWVFPAVYGPSFTMIYTPFLLLIPGILSLSSLALVGAYNAGQGRLNPNMTGAVIALIVIVTGNFIFSERFGIYAAAAVSTAGYISYLAYVMWELKKQNNEIRIVDFFRFDLGDFRYFQTFFRK
jgi:O-antigen/teichoic acid export membrane protein